MGVSQNSRKYDVLPMQLDRFYFPGGVGGVPNFQTSRKFLASDSLKSPAFLVHQMAGAAISALDEASRAT